MSDYHAIGGVSETLRRLLESRMEIPEDWGRNELVVTVGQPPVDGWDDDSGVRGRVNLFLYRVTEDPSLKNQEMPGISDGASYGTPPLSLDLHYLLTSHAKGQYRAFEDQTLSQFLLGSAMRVMHDHPIITDDLRVDADTLVVSDALVGEFERLKVSLDPLPMDDITKVWTALGLRINLSAPYKVSVVQIESRRPRSFPLPVGELPGAGPRIHAVAFDRPVIREVNSRRRIMVGGNYELVDNPHPYVRVGDVLVLEGSNLRCSGNQVALGPVKVDVTETGPDRCEVELTDAMVNPDLGDHLVPGAHPVSVRFPVTFEDAPTERHLLGSAPAAFVLVPRVDNVEFVANECRVDGSCLYAEGLECLTVLGDVRVDSRDYVWADPLHTDHHHIRFPLPTGVSPGAWHVRVRVNGAESFDDSEVVIPDG